MGSPELAVPLPLPNGGFIIRAHWKEIHKHFSPLNETTKPLYRKVLRLYAERQREQDRLERELGIHDPDGHFEPMFDRHNECEDEIRAAATGTQGVAACAVIEADYKDRDYDDFLLIILRAVMPFATGQIGKEVQATVRRLQDKQDAGESLDITDHLPPVGNCGRPCYFNAL